MYQMFPLLAISLIVYAVLTLTGAIGSAAGPWYDMLFIELPMVSGDQWKVSWGDLFLLASMGLLFVELLRSTKTGSESIMNQRAFRCCVCGRAVVVHHCRGVREFGLFPLYVDDIPRFYGGLYRYDCYGET